MGEMFVLAREGVEFQVDNVQGIQGGKWDARGTIYLSSIRLIFVAKTPSNSLACFDLPLVYLHGEKFNQPIFGCNNISGQVNPVLPEGAHWSERPPHSFKILFKEGGVGTFVPLFFNLLKAIRAQMPQQQQAQSAPPSPIPEQQPQVDEMMRSAYVDPNDPSKLYLQQPFVSQDGVRRRNYASQGADT
jgi:hypothetical protein